VEYVELGKTGLMVSPLGLGLAEITRHKETETDEDGGRVLNAALDCGINFLDTAACYGQTEEIIGRTVAHRRDEYVLASKCGHVTGGATGEPWTARTIEESIDRSLRRLRTDHLDVVQLHSCDVDVLERGKVIEAVVRAKDAGKTRFAGYSGDNEAARWAIDSGHFQTLQTSYSVTDQYARRHLLGPAAEAGMGVIVKRPVANGAWGKPSSPSSYADEYFSRAQAMAEMGPVPGEPDDPILLALGFIFASPEVSTAIVGTHNASHLLANVTMVEEALPIPAEAVDELRRRFDLVGGDWPGLM